MLKRHPQFLEIHCTQTVLESGRSRGRKFHLTRSLVAFQGWSLVRDRTKRKRVRHTKYGRTRGMVVGEGGRSTGVPTV